MSIKEFLLEIWQNKITRLLILFWMALFFVALFAPLLASSKPLMVVYKDQITFPLFRVLFTNYFSSKLDIFFNIAMCLFPIWFIFSKLFFKYKMKIIVIFISFLFLIFSFSYTSIFKRGEMEAKDSKVLFEIKPLCVSKHWEENALDLNQTSFLQKVRFNGKSLWANLFFGIRYSFTVAVCATLLSVFIGITIGSIAGYFGKKIDLILGRLIEIWESLPILFVLLLIASIAKKPSLIVVIFSLGFLSWGSLARLIRLEILKQKSLSYVYVLKGFGYKSIHVLCRHLIPTLIPTIFAILPYMLMSAILYEAALAFLGLGDLHSPSIGLLIDEARRSYPLDPTLFWPPALLLIAMLTTLAWFGDQAKQVLDQKSKVI